MSQKQRVRSTLFAFLLLDFTYFGSVQTGFSAQSGSESGKFFPSFQHLTIDDGLSQGMVNAIYQDRKGFMWFGTKAGLNRYDSYRFTIFRNKPFDSTSLSNDYINVVFEDHRGRLWIGTEVGLNCFDPTTETFRRFLHDPLHPFSLSDNNISAIFETSARLNATDGVTVLWIGTFDGGLNKLVLREKDAVQWELPPSMTAQHSSRDEQADHYFIRYQHASNDPKSLSSNRVYDILSDQSGVLWIATDQGLSSLDAPHSLRPVPGDHVAFTRYAHDANSPSSILDNECRTLYETHEGSIWIGTQRGLARMGPDCGSPGTFENHDFSAAPLSLPVPNTIFEICEDHRGALWLVTFEGLLIFDTVEKFYQWIRHDSGNPASLSYDGVRSVFREHSNAIWVGTTGFGLNRWDPKAKQFHAYTPEKLMLESDTDLSISALLEDRRGLTWIFARHEWYQLNRKTGHLTRRPLNFAPEEVNALHEDQDGFLWITNHAGVSRYDERSKRIQKVFPQPGEPNVKLHAIFEDRSGDIWFGSTSELSDKAETLRNQHNALYCWNRKTEEMTKYPISMPETFKSGRLGIRQIVQGQAENFWLATNIGLLRFQPRSGALKIFQNETADSSSLTNDEIKTLMADPLQPDRFLWLGTHGGGLNRFDRTTENFTHYLEEHGLPDNVVYGILADNTGNLWMSTNKGLSEAILEQESREIRNFRNFSVGDGLQCNEFNTNAYSKNAQGDLFFGGIKGFNVFHPDSIKEHSHVPPVMFTDFMIRYQSVRPGQSGSPLQKTIHTIDAITLTPKENVLAIEFAALDYVVPKKTLYSFMLENFDDGWSQPSTRRRAAYTNLKPGKYVFHVRSSNNDGLWSQAGSRLAITIKPYFYQTTWFAALGVSMLGFVVYGGLRWRLRSLEERHRQLEKLVAERTLQLHDREERIRNILNTVVDGIITTDERGRIEGVNPAAEKIFGYHASEMVGQSINMLMPAPVATVHDKYLADYHKTGKPSGLDICRGVTAKRKDGSTFPMELAVSEMQIYGRRFFNSVVRDITERQRAEEDIRQLNASLEQRVLDRTAALHASEDRFRTLYEFIPNMYFTVDAGGTVLSVNQSGREELGYAAEELLGQSVFKIFHEDDKGLVQQQLDACLQDPLQPFAWEFRKVRKDGSILWVSESARALKNHEGQWVVLLVCEDITARKQAEIAIKESQNRYRVLFDEAPTPFWEIDMSSFRRLLEEWQEKGIENLRTLFDERPVALEACLSAIKTLDANRAALRLYKADTKEHLIFNSREIWYAESMNALKEELIAIAAGKINNNFETSMCTLCGDKINVWVHWRVVPGCEQSLNKIFVAIIDTTERKETLHELQTSHERLRALGAHLQSLREDERLTIARDLHDELGQALTSLKMDMSMLKRKARNASGKLDSATVIDDIEGMQNLVGATITKVRSLITELRPEVLDTLGLLPALEWQLEELRKRTGFECEFHSEIKELNIEKAHAVAVFRIFQESLTNILRHAQAHKVTARIEERDGTLWVEVADDGKGMTADELNAPAKFGLLGMRERVLVFGGEVDITSAPGLGTTVKISIPLDRGPAA